MEFMIRVSEAGCECYVQEMPDEDEPDYEEKRKAGERRLRWRRGPRPWGYHPGSTPEYQTQKGPPIFS